MSFKALFKEVYLISIGCLVLSNGILAQNDSLAHHIQHKNKQVQSIIIPSFLMGAGVLTNHSDLEKDLNRNIIRQVGPDFHNPIDDYLQYAPIVQLYIGDLMGFKAKHHWFDRTKSLFFSNLLSAGITHSLKGLLNKTRPNGGDHAFPSGHTCFAFTNAAVLAHEYRSQSLGYVISGYSMAITTGAFRMINNKHWFSDVLFGAGLGMLSAHMIYKLNPLENWNPFQGNTHMILLPSFNQNSAGLKLHFKL